MENCIKVGVGTLLIQNNKVLYGIRKGSHGKNTYGPPGGHLEYGEEIEACSIREVYEESGLIVEGKNVSIIGTVNDIYPNNEKHYVSVFTLVRTFSGTLENREPHKLEKWEWLTWDEIKALGDKNFLPMINFIKKYPDFDPTV